MQRANHRVTTFIYCPDPERSSKQHLFVLNEVSPREQLLLFHHSGSEATFHIRFPEPSLNLRGSLCQGFYVYSSSSLPFIFQFLVIIEVFQENVKVFGTGW